ncbi:hypothetical protein OSB04_018125 [Centaurea solstitialis]|uniref:Uncharacterized protein n=1 Tax=Centaurea solstitialis TaxID=347529 RepID=A0AA38TG13_9ASTR|nr:hypothetical protein OSB04_018125 [Centaurea solstitialis]
MSYTTVPFYSPEESLRLIMGKWKLTGQNFPVWKLHLENVLRAQGKVYVIDKPLSRPKSNAPEKEFAEYFKFMADESDVMSIMSFSASLEYTVDLKVKFCHEVVKSIEDQVGFYRNSGKYFDPGLHALAVGLRPKNCRGLVWAQCGLGYLFQKKIYLIMKEIFSLKLKRGQSVKDNLLEIRRLFKCLSRLGYKITQEELVYLMWFSLPNEIRVTASEYMGEPRMDVAKVHEDILDSLEPKEASADLMDTDWINELGDLSCLECGSQDICVHSFNTGQMDIGLPDAPGSGNHICNHLQGFKIRETLRKDRSNLRVGEGTMLVAEAVGSYSLSLPSGLVLELENCYYFSLDDGSHLGFPTQEDGDSMINTRRIRLEEIRRQICRSRRHHNGVADEPDQADGQPETIGLFITDGLRGGGGVGYGMVDDGTAVVNMGGLWFVENVKMVEVTMVAVDSGGKERVANVVEAGVVVRLESRRDGVLGEEHSEEHQGERCPQLRTGSTNCLTDGNLLKTLVGGICFQGPLQCFSQVPAEWHGWLHFVTDHTGDQEFIILIMVLLVTNRVKPIETYRFTVLMFDELQYGE